MNWGSPENFFLMGGYALFVCSSFGMCAALLVLEPVLIRSRHQAIVRRLRREALADKLDGEPK
jgi:heme exporter protein D